MQTASHTEYYVGAKDFITEKTMAISLENTIQQWRGRIESGPPARMIRWWLGELQALLPDRWQEMLDHARRRLTLSVASPDIILSLEETHRIKELWRFQPDSDSPLLQQQLVDLLLEYEVSEVPRFLLLDIGEVLTKELLMPAAAAPNLEQILTFEMDRHTPFKAEEVYFGWRIVEQRSDEQMRVMLYATPRVMVNRLFETLREANLAPSGVDVFDGGRTLGLNLLPADRQARIINRKTQLNQFLALGAATLLVLTMWLSLALRSHQAEELNDAIAAVRDAAMAVQRIRSQMIDTSKAAGFLTVRRGQSPLAIEVLAEITRQLPDDTYLDRLVIGETSVQMQGKSKNAQQLIELMNKSNMLSSAAFRGSTRLDPRSGMEIFEVNAQITGATEAQENEG